MGITIKIENCPPEFELKCPRNWAELELTSEDGVRHCHECERPVYHAESLADAASHQREGHCIAWEDKSVHGFKHFILGEPSGPAFASPEGVEALPLAEEDAHPDDVQDRPTPDR